MTTSSLSLGNLRASGAAGPAEDPNGSEAKAPEQSDVQQQRLPPIRDDLTLLPGPRAPDGSPVWTISDPLQGKFFRIGWLEFEMISRWETGTVEALLEAVNRETALVVTQTHFDSLIMFLERSSLLRPSGPEARGRLLENRKSRQQGAAQRLIHEYLSFRQPLLRPDALLERLLPFVAPLYTRGMLIVVLCAGVVGLFLILRQWSQFQSTFLYFYSVDGFLMYIGVLAGTKILHEFGHALTAKRLGLRVPTMGVALMVLFPVLYTDTTQAWKLQSRSDRFAIGAAGIVVELAIAAFASVAWSFLDDGPLRSAMFLLATVTWITTLAVNLNPLMRFDGYYLLSDTLDIENLQDRSFELGKWWLRRLLFGVRVAPPERFSPKKTVFLLSYAYLIWIYRFFLFIGIAVLVYQYSFKLLGVALMVFELIWFIGRPVYKEAGQWWRIREEMRLNANTASLLGLLVGLVAILFVPWQSKIAAPAVLKTVREVALFAPKPAQIDMVHLENGIQVSKGAILMALSIPELEHQISVATTKIARLEWLLSRRVGNQDLRDRTAVLRRELAAERTGLTGLQANQRQLTLRAPFDALIVDVDTSLAKGSWIDSSHQLARAVDPTQLIIEAYLRERDLRRISATSNGSFISELTDHEIESVQVLDIDRAKLTKLDALYLASKFGGEIAVRELADGSLIPNESVYRVRLKPISAVKFSQHVERGTVHINAEQQSIASKIWTKVLSVVIREGGF